MAAAFSVNGWQMLPDVGSYGTNYELRAVVALHGLGANLPEDAVYPSTDVDADGQALSGDHRYLLRFRPGALPPVKAFWSRPKERPRDWKNGISEPGGKLADPLKAMCSR